jgi:putative NADH-flavin reductase
MRIALLGASGTIGSAYLARAIADGHEVRALTRDAGRTAAAAGMTAIVGDAREQSAVVRTLADCDVVISAIGPRANTADAVKLLEETATNVIGAMRAQGLSRIVFVAGAGLALPDERRTLGQRAVSAVVKRLAKWVVAGKQREMTLYLASGLDWTALRPPRVVKGPATGRVLLTHDRPRSLRVTSGDVAEAIAAVIDDPNFVRKAPYVSLGGQPHESLTPKDRESQR